MRVCWVLSSGMKTISVKVSWMRWVDGERERERAAKNVSVNWLTSVPLSDAHGKWDWWNFVLNRRQCSVQKNEQISATWNIAGMWMRANFPMVNIFTAHISYQGFKLLHKHILPSKAIYPRNSVQVEPHENGIHKKKARLLCHSHAIKTNFVPIFFLVENLFEWVWEILSDYWITTFHSININKLCHQNSGSLHSSRQQPRTWDSWRVSPG